jgi:hypothetical protein
VPSTADEVQSAVALGNIPAATQPEGRTAREFDGWLPTRVHFEGDRPLLEWCFGGRTRLREPFYEHTLARLLANPATAAFPRFTALDAAEDDLVTGALPPAGFIFHLSRCGSTLISQMLKVLPEHLVLSEPTAIDSVLHAHRRDVRVTDLQRIAWLQALMSAFGRPRTGAERRLFVKFDASHVLELPLVRRAFPNVPWVFVYRDPVEVVASHARQSPGAFPIEAAARRAAVLARFSYAALDQIDATGRFVEYRQLPAAAWDQILAHFGVVPTPDERARMQAVARFDAKHPERSFREDTVAKRSELSTAASAAVTTAAAAAYAALEKQRERNDGQAARVVASCDKVRTTEP